MNFLRRIRLLTAAAGCLGVAVLWAPPASAQTTATLSGVVEDASGGRLPGSSVVMTDTGTNVSRSGVTGADGRFTFASLSAGEYSLRVTSKGFQPYETRVRLSVA